MDTAVASLIDSLRSSIPMVIRVAPASGDYLEGVMSRQELQRCCNLLTEAFGQPAKEFGQVTRLEQDLQKLVDQLGGIRLEQCLFLKQDADGQVAYAALWPWASDASRITLKVGLCKA